MGFPRYHLWLPCFVLVGVFPLATIADAQTGAAASTSAVGMPAASDQRPRDVADLARQLALLKAQLVQLRAEAAALRPPAGGTSNSSWLEWAALSDSIDRLSREVSRLETALAEEQAAARVRVTATAADGLTIESPDAEFRLRLRGYVQTDGRAYLSDAPGRPSDTLEIRRARPVVEATVYRNFSVRLMPDFGEGRVVLYDAYIDAKLASGIAVRAGKFKPPVGLERLASAAELTFVERALPTALVPNRDVGAMVWGEVSRNRLSYAAGIFNGVPDGASADVADHDGKEGAARVFVRPFANGSATPPHDLGLGFAATYGTMTGTVAAPNVAAFKLPDQESFIRYPSDAAGGGAVLANGRHYRLSTQGYYYHGPFGLLAEEVFSSQRLQRGTAIGDFQANAWQLATSYVLTGERASYRGVKPARPLDHRSHGWGAIEVAARYSQMTIDPSAYPVFAATAQSPQATREWAAGANWYLNSNVKLMANFEHVTFASPTGQVVRQASHSVLTRLQFGF